MNSATQSTSVSEDRPYSIIRSRSKMSRTPLIRHKSYDSHELCTIDEVPLWQRDNDFILGGYVRETNSFRRCFKSLFYLNNEWVNVYTHLVPGTLMPVVLFLLRPFRRVNNDNFLGFIPSSIVSIPKFENTNGTDKLIFGLFFFGFMTCLSCSAVFHTIKVHSLKVANMGNSIDYAGIVVLVITSMIGIIYYGYIDSPIPRFIFLAITFLFGVSCLTTSLRPEFKSNEWRPFRALMFIAFGLSALLPIGYGIYRYGFEASVHRCGFWYVVGEGVGYITGAVLYALRIPERFRPGKFDIWGHSHQIFHVFVVLSAFSHFRGLVESYITAHTTLMP